MLLRGGYGKYGSVRENTDSHSHLASRKMGKIHNRQGIKKYIWLVQAAHTLSPSSRTRLPTTVSIQDSESVGICSSSSTFLRVFFFMSYQTSSFTTVPCCIKTSSPSILRKHYRLTVKERKNSTPSSSKRQLVVAHHELVVHPWKHRAILPKTSKVPI